MGNKDKTRDGDAAETNRDHSQDREAARDAVLAKIIPVSLHISLPSQYVP